MDPRIVDPAKLRSRQTSRRYRLTHGNQTMRPFVAIDGEGGNIGDRHEYTLLRAGQHRLETGKPLTAYQCLEFIAHLPPEPLYVGFFFDYDVTMILRDLPPNRVQKLLNRDSRQTAGYSTPLPVDVGPYRIDYTAHKEFRVRRALTGGAWSKWVVINDVGSFFQCSFVTALDKWQIGTPEERKMIADGKSRRADFGELTAGADRYNALEIKLLADLMEHFRDVVKEVGYVPTKWQGPGWIAAKMLESNGVRKTRDLHIPAPVGEAALAAYYGGRFETTAVGQVPGPIYQYDINSAYPAALTQLPCLIHGRWAQRTPVETDELWLSHGTFIPTDEATLYGLPIRSKTGSISFPGTGAGWYWSVELAELKHQEFYDDESWVYVRHCECEPFDFIPDVYLERVRVGKSARGTVLKLALNSLYGKMCQSVGSAPYANPIYASLITAITRAQLSALAHQGPECCEDVYMLATDGVFCGPRDVATSKELGGWDVEVHDAGMFIIMPGLYFTSDNLQPKTRGVPRQAIVEHRQDFYTAYERGKLTGEIGTVTIPLRQFIGLRLANARGKPETAGAWIDTTREISFDVTTKREPGMSLHGLVLRTRPRIGLAIESVPYSKDIGRLNALARLEVADHPDWAEILFGDEL